MNKATKLDDIRKMIKVMSYFFPKMQLKNDFLDLPDGSGSLSGDTIDDGHKWITEIYNSEFNEVYQLWRKQDAKLWDDYVSLGLDGMPEYKEFVRLLTALRKKLKSQNRPNLFKKKGKLHDTLETKAKEPRKGNKRRDSKV